MKRAYSVSFKDCLTYRYRSPKLALKFVIYLKIVPVLYNIEQIYEDCASIALLFYLHRNTANNLENIINRKINLYIVKRN
jgi:hypothetical protein